MEGGQIHSRYWTTGEFQHEWHLIAVTSLISRWALAHGFLDFLKKINVGLSAIRSGTFFNTLLGAKGEA